MTTTGHLDPAVPAAKITVTYTRPDQTTFDREVTTDSEGNWSSTITPQDESQVNNGAGTWTMKSSYAGDVGHRPSTATACTTDVFDIG